MSKKFFFIIALTNYVSVLHKKIKISYDVKRKKIIFNFLQIFVHSNDVIVFFLTKIKIFKNKIKTIPNFQDDKN